MIVITDRQYRAVAAGAAAREVALVASRLSGSDAERLAAARRAVEVAREHGIASPAVLVTLGEIMLAYGPDAVAAGAVPWATELLASSGVDRERRLAECWAIVRAERR